MRAQLESPQPPPANQPARSAVVDRTTPGDASLPDATVADATGADAIWGVAQPNAVSLSPRTHFLRAKLVSYRGRIGVVIAGVLLCGLAVQVSLTRTKRASAGPAMPANFSSAVVAVSDFVRTVEARGEIRSFNPTIVYNDCRWHERRIIELVPEGTWVEEGDLLCVLDTAELREKLVQQQLEIIRVNALIARAEATEAMQDALNERRLASSQYEMDAAENRRAAYAQAEAIHELQQLSSQLRLNEAKLRQGQEEFQHNQFLTALGHSSTSEFERKAIQQERLNREWSLAAGRKTLMESYQHPRALLNLETQAANRRLDYQLTQLDTGFATAFARVNTLEKQQRKAAADVFHDYLTRAIAAATMRAPRAGEVVYAHNREQNRYIEVGSSVYYTQDLIRIVDRSSLIFAGFVTDRLVSRLSLGDPVVLSISSVPETSFSGTLDWIGPIPGPISWFEPESLYHKVQIVLNDGREALDRIPLGSTATAQITVDDRRNILQVPVDAVYSTAKGQEVIVQKGDGYERRQVVCGMTNDVTVEITRGLNEQERVLTAAAVSLREFAVRLDRANAGAGSSPAP